MNITPDENMRKRGTMAKVLTYCGCDPGLSGGWAVISGDKIQCKIAMPTISFTTKEGKTKTELDRGGVLSFLATLPLHTHVVIEKQEPFRGQNIVSTCTQCRHYGMLLMALTAAHMHITEVLPSDWQAHFGIVSADKAGGKTTKDQAFYIAETTFPDVDFRKSDRSRKPHDGMVDASFLAVYCQTLFFPHAYPIEAIEVKQSDGIKGTCEPLESKPGGKKPGTKIAREMF